MSEKRTWRSEEVARNDAALLRAAREVVGEDGAHASVAAIATRAGIGVGTIYRRYRTKEELFQRLSELAAEQYLAAAQEALLADDPWDGLVRYAFASVSSGQGSLASIAGTFKTTEHLTELFAESERTVRQLLDRAREAGVIRDGITVVDLELLIEQLSASPMVEQFRKRGRCDMEHAAAAAHRRIVLLALDGLRSTPAAPLTGDAPGHELFTQRWEPTTHESTSSNDAEDVQR